MLIKTFKYRIYPTKRQEALLNFTLEECRWVYNHLLAERKRSWEEDKKGLTYYSQSAVLPGLKKERESLLVVNATMLQNVAMRVDLAFKAFFRRVKNKEKPGYPRFKGKGQYNSITFPQGPIGCRIKNGKLWVSKIGDIKIIISRELEGKLKIVNVRKSSNGKWFVSFNCEIQSKHLPKTNKTVGIDVGLKTFATLSDGVEIQNPRFFKAEEKNLATAQRKLSKAKKGSKDRIKRRKIVARTHERIKFKRDNFSHQVSTQIVNSYDTICIEDLSVNQMLQDNFKCINKSINDVAWNQFFNLLTYKAENAGKKVIRVNPAYTTQDCHRCGHRQKMELSQRIYSCSCCGLEMDRDLNAALNIKRLGTQSLGLVRTRIRKAPIS